MSKGYRIREMASGRPDEWREVRKANEALSCFIFYSYSVAGPFGGPRCGRISADRINAVEIFGINGIDYFHRPLALESRAVSPGAAGLGCGTQVWANEMLTEPASEPVIVGRLALPVHLSWRSQVASVWTN